jgi:hypothetical protein
VKKLLAVSFLVVCAAGLAAAARADQQPPGPFYLVPTTTKECDGIKNCTGYPGPWVYVPAKGQATYLLACPSKRLFVVGGTDARASSPQIRVTFEGKLGAPLGGVPVVKNGAILLFHASSNNGREGWFQPILGCISLTQKSKRSTVSARAPVQPAPPVVYRTEQFGLKLNRALTRTSTSVGCAKNERLVDSWHSFAASTVNPPDFAYPHAVTIRTSVSGRTVDATFAKDRLFGPLSPRSWAQIGAVCEPS